MVAIDCLPSNRPILMYRRDPFVTLLGEGLGVAMGMDVKFGLATLDVIELGVGVWDSVVTLPSGNRKKKVTNQTANPPVAVMASPGIQFRA
jgi:hypothetical protein